MRRLFAGDQPIANGLEAVIDLPPDQDERWGLAQLAITLAGAQGYSAPGGIVLLGNKTFEEVRDFSDGRCRSVAFG